MKPRQRGLCQGEEVFICFLCTYPLRQASSYMLRAAFELSNATPSAASVATSFTKTEPVGRSVAPPYRRLISRDSSDRSRQDCRAGYPLRTCKTVRTPGSPGWARSCSTVPPQECQAYLDGDSPCCSQELISSQTAVPVWGSARRIARGRRNMDEP